MQALFMHSLNCYVFFVYLCKIYGIIVSIIVDLRFCIMSYSKKNKDCDSEYYCERKETVNTENIISKQ